mmetsp:Transcript_10711/g.19844  ORF Transcript_10711/g.19844 Transcript_10711/m.19844 type:complete len:325 (+) Transcript_10711:41-1015(+)
MRLAQAAAGLVLASALAPASSTAQYNTYGGLGIRPGELESVGVRDSYDENVAFAMVAYASAVTCPREQGLEDWTCKVCIQGSDPVPAPPPLSEVSVFRSQHGVNQGLVGVDSSNDSVIVAFRGSVDWRQWLFDMDIKLVKVYEKEGCRNCWAHQGFWEAFLSLKDEIVPYVRLLLSKHHYNKVRITGHSLGAALAVHCALTLVNKDPSLLVLGYTFGQPRVGTPLFAQWAAAQLPSWFRVVNYLDPVPQCVKLLGYQHMPQEVWYFEKPCPGKPVGPYNVCSAKYGEDFSCQNSRCGGFKICVDGSYHVTYMNIPDLTNVSAIC